MTTNTYCGFGEVMSSKVEEKVTKVKITPYMKVKGEYKECTMPFILNLYKKDLIEKFMSLKEGYSFIHFVGGVKLHYNSKDLLYVAIDVKEFSMSNNNTGISYLTINGRAGELYETKIETLKTLQVSCKDYGDDFWQNFNCKAWFQTKDRLDKLSVKGSTITVSGTPYLEEYVNKQGDTVYKFGCDIDDFRLSSKGESTGAKVEDKVKKLADLDF